MQEIFNRLADFAIDQLQGNEVLLFNFSGETSDFVRLNKNAIRQAGYVKQMSIWFDLIEGNRHAGVSMEMTGDQQLDESLLKKNIKIARMQRDCLPDDPWLNYSTEIHHSESIAQNHLPDTGDAIDCIISSADGQDLVGIWANGEVFRGFANSMGQRNWHSSANFNFDWSLYHDSDKAVKLGYAGFEWQTSELAKKMDAGIASLEKMKLASQTLKPGCYRAYLAPAAMYEIAGLLMWEGFGLENKKTDQTPLIQMIKDDRRLSDKISITENRKQGIAPGFTSEGFVLPDAVKLINKGRYHHSLASARSAKEYGESVNAANEYPGSFSMAPGDIDKYDILKTLDTGIYINNLWYTNFSDYESCRITGMTRYACFQVANGEIVAPVNVMRFDETIYNILGDKLVGLVSEQENIFDPSSYHARSTDVACLPGVLVNDFSLTL